MNENEKRELEGNAEQIPAVQPIPEPASVTAPPTIDSAPTETGNTPSPASQPSAVSSVPTAPPAKKQSPMTPVFITLIAVLGVICTVLLLIVFAESGLQRYSGGGTTVIYENSSWVNEGELVSSEAIVNTAAKTSPSVVAITTESVSYNGFLGNYVSEGAGSGVICTEDGFIITNHHVIDGATTIRVTLENGDTFDAELVGTDSQTDLAVIKIDAEGLTPAVFAAEGSLSVGQTVIAIGNPLGTLSNTVTSGVVSALARQINISGTTMILLQHNASVSPGNSGGGLFNINGELVGIVNAKSSGEGVEGVGFAIPVETYRKVVEELIENGYVTGRPQLGITAYEVLNSQALYSLPEEIRTCVKGINSYGVYIGDDSAVTYAKGSDTLEPGDYISSVDDQLINEFADLTALLYGKDAGDILTMTVYRYNQETQKTVQVHVKIVLSERTQ